VADDAGLALEAMHWAVNDVLGRAGHTAPSDPDPARAWRDACSAMRGAQTEVSRQGTRLAIRLGSPRGGVESPCVAAYDELQDRYRAIVSKLQASPGGSDLDVPALRETLDALADHHTYLNQASLLLKPRSV
jgi:hypothetical protein